LSGLLGAATVDLVMHVLRNGGDDAEVTIVLAHGAGLPMDAPFMAQVAEGLAADGHRVVRFEFPYMARARREGVRAGPDRMPVLEACFREVVAAHAAGCKLVLAGKSMGGRVATRVADELGVRGVIAYGYPFHPPKKPKQVRTSHLQNLQTPCLVLQGTRDPLGLPEEIASYVLSPSIEVRTLEDGEHSFRPRKASGRTEAQNIEEAIQQSCAFIRRVCK
jgi:hypothetical protein